MSSKKELEDANSLLQAELTSLRAECGELREKVAYYDERGQKLLNSVAETFTAVLSNVDDEGVPIPPSAAMLGVIRQFLKDQSIVDLKGESEPVDYLARNYAPYPVEEDHGGGAFQARASK